jgi:hypothetical protein
VPIGLVLAGLLLGVVGCGGGATPAREVGDPVARTTDSGAPEPGATRSSKAGRPEQPPKKKKKKKDSSAAADSSFVGDGYGFDTLDGWTDATDRLRALQPTIDLAAVEPDAADGFADNVNVIVSPWSGSLGALEKQAVTELDAVATDIRVQSRVTIGGTAAGHLTSRITFGKQSVGSDQYLALRDGRAFLITFAVEASKSAQERQRIISAVLDSWVWRAGLAG